jgi:hypothetical protein
VSPKLILFLFLNSNWLIVFWQSASYLEGCPAPGRSQLLTTETRLWKQGTIVDSLAGQRCRTPFQCPLWFWSFERWSADWLGTWLEIGSSPNSHFNSMSYRTDVIIPAVRQLLKWIIKWSIKFLKNSTTQSASPSNAGRHEQRFHFFFGIRYHAYRRRCQAPRSFDHLLAITIRYNSFDFFKIKWSIIIERMSSGMVSQLLAPRPHDLSNLGLRNWNLTSAQFWGENPTGQWRLYLTNLSPNSPGMLHLCSLILLGFWTLIIYTSMRTSFNKKNYYDVNPKNKI